MTAIRSLCWWLPKCRGCWRRDLFEDGLCFQCWHTYKSAATWRGIGDAIAEAIAEIVSQWASNSKRNRLHVVRRRSRSNPSRLGRIDQDKDVRELRKIAGLDNPPLSSSSGPSEDEDPGKAKAK
jgi:hypothetical protein